MFLARDHIYTVHTNPEVEDPADRIVLVREGFSIWAFVLTILWTLGNRLWLFSALYLVLVVLVIKGGALLELSEATRGIVQLGLQAWLGFAAHDAQRDALARRGYTETSVVAAPTEWAATHRYCDHHQTV